MRWVVTLPRNNKNLPVPKHGGDLGDIVDLTTNDAAAWLDLSTGINPNSYPMIEVSEAAYRRLPSAARYQRLSDAARAYYGCDGKTAIVPGAGSQALIQMLPQILKGKRVAILGFTYNEHERVWRLNSRDVEIVASVNDLQTADIAIVVNPNNPDGMIYDEAVLRPLAEHLTARGGWLIVDEAFGDVAVGTSAVNLANDTNTIVLKSLGKFFGLAGLRVGFLLASPEMAAHAVDHIGPWPVSGPGVEIATIALEDSEWQNDMRIKLKQSSQRLDALLAAQGFKILGGTDLFRLMGSDTADALFHHLLDHQIYVRKYTDKPEWLRFGVPGNDEDFARLEIALKTFSGL